jgi:hypothetical protein
MRLCVDFVTASSERELAMPVRLDQVPTQALRPARPRVWLWLGFLLLCWLAGLALMAASGTQPLQNQSACFWGLALGVPTLGWCLLGFCRTVIYLGQQCAADGWDEAREDDLARRIGCGRRSQQILAVSLYTALSAQREPPHLQLDALLNGTKALKTQPSRLDGAALSYSRLAGDTDEELESAVRRVMLLVLADLSKTLMLLPSETPLALLLEVDCSLPEKRLLQLWQQAWTQSGIRQSVRAVEGSGLAVLDKWLDQHIRDQALLLVIAIKFASNQPEGAAEAAVGLLFGNRLTQMILPPVGYLHRPELERGTTPQTLLYAARQALDWVPLEVNSVEHIWRVAIEAQREIAMSTVLAELALPEKHSSGSHDLDTLLGHPGKASPWLAIAAASQALQRGIGPQFIFSGSSPDETELWSMVLTPALPLSSRDKE